MTEAGAAHAAAESSDRAADGSRPDEAASLEKPAPTNWLARVWDAPAKFVAVSFVLLVAAPGIAAVAAALLEGTLRLPGEAQGLLESITLTYLPTVFLCLYFARRAIEKQYGTLRSLAGRDLLRFASDEDAGERLSTDHGSRLRPDEYEELLRFYGRLLAAVTFRSHPDDGTLRPAHQRRYRLFKRGIVLVWLLGLVGLVTTTYNHWFSVAVYGFDTWYSASHPLGFAVRTAYNAVVFLGIGPVIVVQLAVLSFLLYHPFKFLEARNGLRYRRYAPDGVGGYSPFGHQSLHNVLVILPLSIIGVVYSFFLPPTRQLLVGGALYVLAFPVLFFGPLLHARSAIQGANERELNAIADAYADNYEDYKRELTEAESVTEIDDQHLLTRHEALQKADDVHKEIRDRPSWPFDRGILQRFASLMLTLISGFILSIL